METAVVMVLVIAAMLAVALFLRRQSAAEGRWGIGSLRAECPRCRTPLPTIRAPSSWREMLWGGWTCPQCRCKVDKYGRERVEA
ncbi:MAG: hypothetical protein IT537_12480 [Hyphomicrobiales bacterium]|nr:hypothetical protein [Hyphomicrobiales bacterium]